jgi:hypothetical protein
MLPEIEHISIDLVAGRLRKENLASVAGRRDTRPEVDVKTDVPLIRELGRPGVKAHPDSDWAIGERSLGLHRRRNRLGSIPERDEERVALRIDLDTAVALKCFAQRVSVLRQRIRVAASQLVQQSRRPLDVGEEERDRATRKLPHRQMIRQSAGSG